MQLTRTRPPVAGLDGAVAAAHPLASQAGLDMLRAGGNAVDAIVATAATLNVVEPYMSGVGGVGLLLLHLAGGETRTLNFTGHAPAAADPAKFTPQSQELGPRACLVPGNVAGWLEALRAHGTKTSRDESRGVGTGHPSRPRRVRPASGQRRLDRRRARAAERAGPGDLRRDGTSDWSGATPARARPNSARDRRAGDRGFLSRRAGCDDRRPRSGRGRAADAGGFGRLPTRLGRAGLDYLSRSRRQDLRAQLRRLSDPADPQAARADEPRGARPQLARLHPPAQRGDEARHCGSDRVVRRSEVPQDPRSIGCSATPISAREADSSILAQRLEAKASAGAVRASATRSRRAEWTG